MPTHAELLEKYPEATSTAYVENTKPQPGKRHVVLSTKYQEPWFGISVKVKSALIQQGCTVYNPNTDNLSEYRGDKAKADGAWLKTFNLNLEDVKNFKGFVLQLQQGTKREKSDMQEAEEMQSGWLHVPRIGVFFFESESSGLTSMKAEILPRAVELAASQWEKGILPHLQMASEIYEVVPGHAGDVGSQTGYLKVTFPSGECYEGQYVNGKRHGHGITRYPSGECYEGQYANGKKHGHGIARYANGDRYEGEYEHDKRHGQGKYTYWWGRVDRGEWRNGVEVVSEGAGSANANCQTPGCVLA